MKSEDQKRLSNAKIIWISTVSNNLIPHLVPVWFVMIDSKIYVCTEEKSVKVKNLKENSNLAFSLEDGINPLIGNGKAIVRYPDKNKDSLLIKGFKEKYGWDITTDEQYDILLEIKITKLLFRK